MAKAYQCDRCNNYYTANKENPVPGKPTDYIMSGIAFNSIKDSHVKEVELCDDCCKEIVDWFYMRNKK